MLKTVLILCGLIHAIPLAGLIGADWLETLYGITALSADTITLMQHRALLLGIVALLCFQGAFNPVYRNLATLLVIVSMSGYLWLVEFNNDNAKLMQVLWIDTGLLLLLVFSWFWDKHARTSITSSD